MNTRVCSVVAAVTLMSLCSGCGGMRNFLFGRGARCGSGSPQFGNTMQAPAPYAPAAAPTYQTPTCQAPAYQAPCQNNVVTAPRSGCSWFGGCLGRQTPAPQYSAAYPDCNCSSDQVISGGCGCGTVVDGYVPMVSDPYLSGGIVDGGQVISDQVIGTQPMGGQSVPMTDQFQARKFDTDGNRILWEEPLPSGNTEL